MRKYFPIALCLLLFAACKPESNEPEPKPSPDVPEEGISFKESDELFPNPERGWLIQAYYTSGDLQSHVSLKSMELNRTMGDDVTVYLHSYYLTDYIASDIPQEFLDRLELNMNTLREGGGKVVLRFSYKNQESDTPWDATPEWIHKHIDQIAPYLQKHSDVIICVQCGFIGVWGEWYYTSNFKMNPVKDEDFEPRWQVLEHLLQVVPEDRQVALRTPGFKRRYLRMRGLGEEPLTAEEAFKPTNKARICAHNDCFVSSSNDVGTYSGPSDRAFWEADSKYTFMGGETCQYDGSTSSSTNAIKQMEASHWTYINRDYEPTIVKKWRKEDAYKTIQRRLGYRLALDNVVLTEHPKAGEKFEARIKLHNSGFAAPMNKRDLELILVSNSDPAKKFVYPQTEDPRFWLPDTTHTFTLSCTLDADMAGDYKLYMNLPDPYPSLHNDPRYSIRLANEGVWDEQTGYNLISTVTVE